ncbi:unnamed protein product [Angiostrongylus costaricensis]|uniref:Transposase n=1 Tax=Angiostrongylus costaricensis TaxID=334426 RepID=A0A0R3PTI8_ANGCS|nr:unnamed protein product [Angiostrongylus costaricensis]
MTNKTVLLFKKGDLHDIGNYRLICLLSVVYKLFARIILDRIDRTPNEGDQKSKQDFGTYKRDGPNTHDKKTRWSAARV